MSLVESKADHCLLAHPHVVSQHSVAIVHAVGGAVPVAHEHCDNHEKRANCLEYQVYYQVVASHDAPARGVGEVGQWRVGGEAPGVLAFFSDIYSPQLSPGALSFFHLLNLKMQGEKTSPRQEEESKDNDNHSQPNETAENASQKVLHSDNQVIMNSPQELKENEEKGEAGLEVQEESKEEEKKPQNYKKQGSQDTDEEQDMLREKDDDDSFEKGKSEEESKGKDVVAAKAGAEWTREKAVKIGYNVAFYLDLDTRRRGLTISSYLLNFKGDFERMERDHAYIQLIFPNFYESRFNMAADPLNPKEAKVFRSDLTVAKNFVLAYESFLQFLGIELADKATGRLKILNNKSCDRDEGLKRQVGIWLIVSRLRYRLVVCTHNQLRMWRILSSLSANGLWVYAQRLMDYLAASIAGVKLYEEQRKHYKVTISKDRVAALEKAIKRGDIQEGALKASRRGMFYYDKWIVFASEDSKKVAVAACTPTDKSHIEERSVFLKQFK